MSYIALNPSIFNAALAGAMAGQGISGRALSLLTAGDYADLAIVAGAFAQRVDTIWGSSAANNFQVQMMGEACEGYWAERKVNNVSPFATPSTYADEVTAIIATVTAGQAYITTQGIAVVDPTPQLNARNVMLVNTLLTAYTVASSADNDNVAGGNVEGDVILLVGQTAKNENGPYEVGIVAGGVADLTRIADLPNDKLVYSGLSCTIAAGANFPRTVWFIATLGTIAIGADSHDWYPEQVRWTEALVGGELIITDVPIFSTVSSVQISRRTANTTAATDGGYHPTDGGADGITPGLSGVSGGAAEIIIQACVLAGTINVADISTLHVLITNR